MATSIFRVTVRGRFAGLDDDGRAALLAEVDAHDSLSARFDAAGTLTYDRALDFFSFRVEVRVRTEDGADPATALEAALQEAEARTLAELDRRGAGHRGLKAVATDMADVWR